MAVAHIEELGGLQPAAGDTDHHGLLAPDAPLGDELLQAGRLLEREYADVQDIEFTVERGRLYLLQARSAKRSPLAAVRTAVDLASEGLIDPDTALGRISADQLASVLAPRLRGSLTSGAEILARGTPACPGVATGTVVSDAEAAEAAGTPRWGRPSSIAAAQQAIRSRSSRPRWLPRWLPFVILLLAGAGAVMASVNVQSSGRTVTTGPLGSFTAWKSA